MITAQVDYMERNALGFEGDHFLKAEIEALIKKHSIDLVIETGSFYGHTTKQFAKMVKRVITIEANAEYYREACENLKDFKNVKPFYGESQKVLPSLLDKRVQKKKVLFFLDAHWQEHCPLNDELAAIAAAGMKPVIVIHDFKVPGHPTLGFDTYNGKALSIGFVYDSLVKIYGPTFDYHYNVVAAGARRGCVFIEPKQE